VLFRGKRLMIGIGDASKVLLANETPTRDDTGIAVKSAAEVVSPNNSCRDRHFGWVSVFRLRD
jgi:hypothetical protein